MPFAQATAPESVMNIPHFWRRFLLLVAIGKAAVVGAGIALAALGALDITFALTAKVWMAEIRPYYLDLAALGGGAIGAAARAVWTFIDTASSRNSIAGV